jgi:Zn-dependent M28 family amino/carboxypeptidase
MLEIARLLAGHELAHPVRFFATNVEEVGLQGVKAFAARAAEEGTPIAGAFNLDAIGSSAHGAQVVLNTDENGAWLEDLLSAVNDQYGLGQDLWPKVNPAIVADDNFLRDRGFPTVLVARELFGWSTLHHTIDDTIETVDLDNVKMATALVLGAVANLVVTT